MITIAQESEELQAAIAVLESKRHVVGDKVAAIALASMRSRLINITTDQELRYVTMLFLDVVGSTDLSRRLDPEDLHRIVDGTLERCASVIVQHGGKVLNFAGDSMLAVFGAAESRDDDAQRCVIAGLKLLEIGSAVQKEVRTEFSFAEFNVRVGAHSGSVLLGGGVDAERNIRGFHVNYAARMEQTAPVGGLRVSAATCRLIRDDFEVSPQDPIVVKGVEKPQDTYLVVRHKPKAFGATRNGTDGLRSKHIGRDAELRTLQEAFERIANTRRFDHIAVVGEAGLGKSRLLQEFEIWASETRREFVALRGRATFVSRNKPYGLLRDVLSRTLHIAEGDPIELVQEKFELGMSSLAVNQDPTIETPVDILLLGHLLGIDYSFKPQISDVLSDPRQVRDRGFHVAGELIRGIALSRAVPVVLLIDDLHWADLESIEFLRHLSRTALDVGLLILTFSRPSPDHSAAFITEHGQHQEILLSPLGKADSRILASELLAKLAEYPTAVTDILINGADGNPYYMEELVKMLMDEGAIDTSTDRWSVVTEKLVQTHVPETISGLLQTRIDRLHYSEKLTLQLASVLGVVFSEQALAALDPRAPLNLPSLQSQGLVAELPTAQAVSGKVFAFSSQVLHQVAYETQLKSNRQRLHGQAAKWFEIQCTLKGPDNLGVTAHHFAKSEQHRTACIYYTKAAAYAASRYAHGAALEQIQLGLESLNSMSSLAQDSVDVTTIENHWSLLEIRERILDLEGARADQRADIEMLFNVAHSMKNDHKVCDAALRKCNYFMRTGDYASMRDAALRTMDLADASQQTELGLRAMQRLAVALTYLGDADRGRAIAVKGLQTSRDHADLPMEALFLNALSVIADAQSDQVATLEYDMLDLEINQKIGNRRNEAIALTNLGHGWLQLGDSVTARHYLEQGLQLAQQLRDRGTEPNILTALSVLDLREGKSDNALRKAQLASDLATTFDNPDFASIALCAKANAYLDLGLLGDAKNTFDLAIAATGGSAPMKCWDAQAGLARVALSTNDMATAITVVNAILEQSNQTEKLDGSEAPNLVRLACIQVLDRAKDPRASILLETSCSKLLTSASMLSNAKLRVHFLNDIPEHAALLSRSSGSPGTVSPH